MSWQAYVDNLLGSGKIDRAALYSRAGDSLWAASSGFAPSGDEIIRVARGFDDPAGLQEHGLGIQGEKYFLLKSDDRSIYGKKGDDGILAVRTKQGLLLAHYSAPVLAGEAVKVVEDMADYLISVNY